MATSKAQATNESETSRQLAIIFQSLDGYKTGSPTISTLGSSSVSAPKGATSSPQLDPVKFDKSALTSKSVQMAPSIMALAAAITKDPQLAQAAGLAGLGVKAAQPNISVASLAPSFLGQIGGLTGTPVLGQLATALSFMNNGVTTPGVMGLLGLSNPAIGLAGLVNSIAGNPIGDFADSIRNSFVSNPTSINSLASAGVGITQQAYNSINQNQVNNMDTAAMDSLMASLDKSPTKPVNNSGYGNGGGNTSAGDGMGENGGRGSSGMGSASGPGE